MQLFYLNVQLVCIPPEAGIEFPGFNHFFAILHLTLY